MHLFIIGLLSVGLSFIITENKKKYIVLEVRFWWTKQETSKFKSTYVKL